MNYFYFNTADHDLALYPASAFRGAEQAGGTVLDLYFSPMKITDVAATDVCDKIALTITDGKEKEVLETIATLANSPLAADAGFITIGDDTNGVYIENVTAVGSIEKAV
jgi:hypothetical protein